jgi:hypothetical protein
MARYLLIMLIINAIGEGRRERALLHSLVSLPVINREVF